MYQRTTDGLSYCNSRKIAEEYTVQTYDLRDEFVAINHIQCGKCGVLLQDDPRESVYRQQEGVHQGSYLTGNPAAVLNRTRPHPRYITGIFRGADMSTVRYAARPVPSSTWGNGVPMR